MARRLRCRPHKWAGSGRRGRMSINRSHIADRRSTDLVAFTLIASLVAAGSGEARQSPEAIARRIVIGQAYVSGNVYIAGFDPDEKRAWPRRLTLVPLREASPRRLAADFSRTVTQDSE